jgi:DNA integrity scanning protein DisA with diadenylate cyclase activity
LEHKLLKILEKVRTEVPGNIFTGIGVIVCDSLEYLPFLPMSDKSRVISEVDVVSKIVEGSLATNVNHDGFNILGKNFNLIYKNVFISPPIAKNIELDIDQGFGARYVAAILASKIEGVIVTAVVSNSYGIVIFKNGKVVNIND